MRINYDRLARLLERAYGRILAIYPAEFRHEYAAEMVEYFGEDCRRAARRRGLAGLARQSVRTLGDLIWTAPGVHMEILRQDLRFALRMLWKAPSFALTAIVALALGIGANSAIFSLVHAILLTPLSFPQPDRLVMIWDKSPRGIDRNNVSPPNYLDYRAGAHSLTGLAAFYEDSANLAGQGDPQHVSSLVVTPEFFTVLGVQPSLGSGFGAGGAAASLPQVVLSYELWRARFHEDPGVLGTALRIDDKDYTITGVMPAQFHFASPDIALWTSMAPGDLRASRQAHFLSTVGRVKPGVSLSQVQAELAALAADLARAYPASNRGWGVVLLPLDEHTVGKARQSLLVLLGAVGFILLIACANVANLLLARSTHRQGEIAVRTALGAGAVRICRQMLTESLLVSTIGAGIGLVLSWGALSVLRVLRPAGIPRLEEVAIDGWVVAFTFGLAFVTGVVCGLAPVLRVSRGDLREGLKETAAHRSTFAGHRLRGALITCEIALSLLLLVGSGLLIRTFVHLQNLDPGFRTGQATSSTFDLPSSRYPNAAARGAFIETVWTRTQSLPGIVSAGMISKLPLTGGEGYNRFGFTIEHGDPAPNGENHRFYARWITPGYFGSMGIPLLGGRDFTLRDRAGSSPAVIIDAALARRYFPGENPVGKFLRLSYANSVPREIIGVVGEVRLVAMEMEAAPQIYVPILQEPQLASASLVVRTTMEHTAAAEAVRRELQSLDSSLALYDVRPVADLVAQSIAPRRFNMLLMTLLAAVALILASVGIYGVISFMVGERRHEIGIRMAMGARPLGILLLVVRQGMRYAAAGIVMGLAVALWLTRLMTGLLFGVKPVDAWTFGTVAVMTATVACLACLVPAMRASRVDPARALRWR